MDIKYAILWFLAGIAFATGAALFLISETIRSYTGF